jgi:hypothetical protein
LEHNSLWKIWKRRTSKAVNPDSTVKGNPDSIAAKRDNIPTKVASPPVRISPGKTTKIKTKKTRTAPLGIAGIRSSGLETRNPGLAWLGFLV